MTSTLSTTSHRTLSLSDLQGSWVTVAGRRDAKFLIAGHRFTFEIVDGDIYMGTIRIDSTADPVEMDLKIEEGPARYKGLTAFCIVHWDGEHLQWCPTRPGSGVRLTGFPAVDDDRFLSLVFRPQRPRRSN